MPKESLTLFTALNFVVNSITTVRIHCTGRARSIRGVIPSGPLALSGFVLSIARWTSSAVIGLSSTGIVTSVSKSDMSNGKLSSGFKSCSMWSLNSSSVGDKVGALALILPFQSMALHIALASRVQETLPPILTEVIHLCGPRKVFLTLAWMAV